MKPARIAVIMGGIAFASVFAAAVGGCKLKQLEEQVAQQPPQYELYERIGELPYESGVYKFNDLKENNVCYFAKDDGIVKTHVSIECMVAKSDTTSR